MKRPSNVPVDWVLGRCAGCKQSVWYDLGVERATLDVGKKFYPVCSAECALHAVQHYGSPTKPP